MYQRWYRWWRKWKTPSWKKQLTCWGSTPEISGTQKWCLQCTKLKMLVSSSIRYLYLIDSLRGQLPYQSLTRTRFCFSVALLTERSQRLTSTLLHSRMTAFFSRLYIVVSHVMATSMVSSAMKTCHHHCLKTVNCDRDLTEVRSYWGSGELSTCRCQTRCTSHWRCHPWLGCGWQPPKSCGCKHLWRALKVFLLYVSRQLDHANRIDVVCDQYKPNSLKSQTRDKRGKMGLQICLETGNSSCGLMPTSQSGSPSWLNTSPPLMQQRKLLQHKVKKSMSAFSGTPVGCPLAIMRRPVPGWSSMWQMRSMRATWKSFYGRWTQM